MSEIEDPRNPGFHWYKCETISLLPWLVIDTGLYIFQDVLAYAVGYRDGC